MPVPLITADLFRRVVLSPDMRPRGRGFDSRSVTFPPRVLTKSIYRHLGNTPPSPYCLIRVWPEPDAAPLAHALPSGVKEALCA